MFEFLFKRPGDNKSGDKPAGQGPQPSASGPAAPSGAASASASSANATAARALQAGKLSQVQGDEAAAVEFILQCEFSELRLTAAEFVHSPAALERVHTAMRNTDRRVAKLMQSRLDAHRHHEAEHRRAQAALEHAQSLLNDALLTPNHVADLDRKWAVIAAPELQADFQRVRAALGQRLESQVQLQRAMIDRLAALRQLSSAVASGSLPAADLAARLEVLAQEQAAALQAPEHTSLPRGLGAEFGVEHQKLQASLHAIEAGQSALAARSAFLELQQGKPVAELNADALRKEWKALPALPQGEAGGELQRRFDALLTSLPQPEPRKPRESRPAQDARVPAAAQNDAQNEAQNDAQHDARKDSRKQKGADQHFLDAMDAMEAALQQGSLGTAAELDKTLKEAREKGMRLTPAQSDRLAHVRAELKRLSDWARWGGNVSREELIKNVETLATQNLAMSELAKKVGSMRERWKALDSLSGAAPKSLWERFDAACSAAYAPAAAHFRQLADERHANAARAEKLVEEARAEIARLQSGEADWKHVAGTVQRLRLGWSHLGAIDRKEKKRLDAQFTDALNVMQAPLEEQRKGEMAEREAIIEEAAAIDPHDRHAIDTMRALQQRWQEHARALPLERKSEQALWQRFRAVCDEVFQRRKDSMHEADIERRAHEAAKEAISARLEAAAPEATPTTMGKLLREAQAEWQAIGPVPRAHEARIEKRYHAAVALVQQHVEGVRRAAGVAQANQLRDKLRLVQELEAGLAVAVDGSGQGDAADWEARWSALPALDAELERTLRGRFDAALQALGGDRAAYAKVLERNRDILLHDLLRMEIGAGIDSGPEFARERLKLQVEVLQSSLKSGQKNGAGTGGGNSAALQLRALLALPALLDARTASRIEQLSLRLAKDGK